jgi:hypothetical protein
MLERGYAGARSVRVRVVPCRDFIWKVEIEMCTPPANIMNNLMSVSNIDKAADIQTQ